MQLDKTHVVIRARSLPEIGDLALLLTRRFPAASIFAFIVGALPWAVLDLLLLGHIPWAQYIDPIYDEEMFFELARYAWLMITLVFLQAPIAGVLTTMLIGRAVFEQRVTWRSALGDVGRIAWRWFWRLGVLRGPIPLMLLLATNWGGEFAPVRELLLPLACLGVAVIQRGSRPFLPEILLLERCPPRSGDPDVVTLPRRHAALHGPMAAELFGRFLMVSLILSMMAVAVCYSLLWGVGSVLTGNWDIGLPTYLLIVPLSLWAIAGLSVLVRFLSYLDLRIRLEGWEVDLAVRAEAQRQFGASLDAAVRPRLSRQGRAGKPVAATAVALGLVAAAWSAAPAVAAENTDTAAGAADPATAEDDSVVVASPLGTSWYDAREKTLIPLQVRAERPENENRASQWEAGPAKVRQPSNWNFLGGVRQFIGWMLLAAVGFVLVGILAYLISRAEPGSLASAKSARTPGTSVDEQTLQRMQQLPAELRVGGGDLLALAERWMREGDFRKAVVALFGHQLLLLDRCGQLRLARGKTNGRYLREVRARSGEAEAILRQTVRAFEASYFGGHAPSAALFEVLWSENRRLPQIVHAELEAAA